MMIRRLVLEEKAQEGAAFRLLVEAIMGVFILMIVIGIINWVDNWRFVVSKQQLFEGFQKALQTPNGNVVSAQNLVLNKDATYSSRQFAEMSNMQGECIELGASGSPSFRVTNSGTGLGETIKINNMIETTVYYRCQKNPPGDTCPISCEIRFGEPFD